MVRRASLPRPLLSVSLLACVVLPACGPGRFDLWIDKPTRVGIDSVYVIVASEPRLKPAEQDETAPALLDGAQLSKYVAFAQYRNLEASGEKPGTSIGTWKAEGGKNDHPESIKIGLSKKAEEITLEVPRSLFDLYPDLAAAAVVQYRDGRIIAKLFDHQVLERTSKVRLRLDEKGLLSLPQ
jgi:hypothetical protein